MKRRIPDVGQSALLRCVAVIATLAAPFAAQAQTWTEVFPTISDNVTVTNLVVKAGEYKQASAKYSVTIGSGVVVQPGGMFRTRITLGLAKEASPETEQPQVAEAMLPKVFGAHMERGSSGLLLRYALPKAAHIEWVVYDTRGRMVAQLLNQSAEAGWYTECIGAGKLAAGSYVYKFRAGARYRKTGTFLSR